MATGLASGRDDLDVWVVGGDGDMLSIGGNHLIHALRRNINLTILLFNNRIYGLTKGQYSPTSEVGKVTKSTPFGSLDQPFNPVSVALGAEATFVARTHDMDRKHMMETLRRAREHRGASFVEIFQNCNVFNDGAFEKLTARAAADAYPARARSARPLRGRRPPGCGGRPARRSPGGGGRALARTRLVHTSRGGPGDGVHARGFQRSARATPTGCSGGGSSTARCRTQLARPGAPPGDLEALLHSRPTWTRLTVSPGRRPGGRTPGGRRGAQGVHHPVDVVGEDPVDPHAEQAVEDAVELRAPAEGVDLEAVNR